MTPQTLKALDRRLQHFLEDLIEPMGRSERRHWARVYLQGLLLDGERKSVEPMASRIEGADVQALRQFVGQSPWEVAEVERRLADKVVDLLSEPEVWIIDETAFPKAGQHSVGVGRPYCGTLGKGGHCQGHLSCPVAALPPQGMVGGGGASRGSEAASRDALPHQDGTGLGGDRPGVGLGTAPLAGGGGFVLWG